MTPEEIKKLDQLSAENASTQKMLLDIRNMLSQFIKDKKALRRERCWA